MAFFWLFEFRVGRQVWMLAKGRDRPFDRLLAQQLDEPEKAVQWYRSALDVRPDFPEALSNLGHALQTLGRGGEAQNCWVSALEKKPELARGYFLKSS